MFILKLFEKSIADASFFSKLLYFLTFEIKVIMIKFEKAKNNKNLIFEH